jgi:hypothetical protein
VILHPRRPTDPLRLKIMDAISSKWEQHKKEEEEGGRGEEEEEGGLLSLFTMS